MWQPLIFVPKYYILRHILLIFGVFIDIILKYKYNVQTECLH